MAAACERAITQGVNHCCLIIMHANALMHLHLRHQQQPTANHPPPPPRASGVRQHARCSVNLRPESQLAYNCRL